MTADTTDYKRILQAIICKQIEQCGRNGYIPRNIHSETDSRKNKF